MKKLLTALLLSSLLTPQVFASDASDLSDSELAEYFVFDEGTWWEYSLNEQTLRVVSESCDGELCFALSSDTSTASYSIDNGKIYIDNLNGEDTDGMVIMDIDGLYLDEWSDAYAEWFGYGETDLSGTEMSLECEIELGRADVLNYEGDSLVNSCTIEVSTEESAYTVQTEETYIKGVGRTELSVEISTEENPWLDLTMELTDTSIDLADVDDLTQVSGGVFSDVDEDNDNIAAIEYLYDEGVIAGYNDGTFRPENTVNRAELLKILVEGQGITPDENEYKNCFPDVTTDWYAKYVCFAKEEGWVSGYPDGTFQPGNPVNKVEALKILLNSQNVDLDETADATFTDYNADEWFSAYVATAQDLGLLEEEGSMFNPDGDRTRASISENLYRLLLNMEIDGATEAMAESTCLVLDLSGDELDTEVSDIMEEFGYEDTTDIDDFIARIRDFDFFSDMQEELSSRLEEQCGAGLEELEIDTDELAESMLSED